MHLLLLRVCAQLVHAAVLLKWYRKEGRKKLRAGRVAAMFISNTSKLPADSGGNPKVSRRSSDLFYHEESLKPSPQKKLKFKLCVIKIAPDLSVFIGTQFFIPVSYTHPPSPRDRQKSRMPSSA